MYSIATALLIIGTLAGATYGVMFEQTHLETIFSSATGGFVGSLIGGILFTYLYLTAEEEEEEEETPLPKTSTALPPKEQPKLILKNKPENDKKKIKRLEQEIQAIKNNRR